MCACVSVCFFVVCLFIALENTQLKGRKSVLPQHCCTTVIVIQRNTVSCVVHGAAVCFISERAVNDETVNEGKVKNSWVGMDRLESEKV